MQLEYNGDSNPSFTLANPSTLAAIIDIATLQRQAPELQRFFNLLERNILPDDSVLAKKTSTESDRYHIRDGILYHMYTPQNSNSEIPRNSQEQIVIQIGRAHV